MNYLLINYIVSILILFYSFVDSEKSYNLTNNFKYMNETDNYDSYESVSVIPYYLLGVVFLCCLPCLICVG